jgi:SAM-dependent methyltransferase
MNDLRKRRLLKQVLRRLAFLRPIFEVLASTECRLARVWVAGAHKRLLGVQWGFPSQREHFDHHVDLFYQWLETRNPLWVERGVFGSLALRGGDVLELACGDGFNARNFYSLRSRYVAACDFDPEAIMIARRKNCSQNVDFILADIRTSMPNGQFDNVVWDAAIEHFTPGEIEQLLKDIKSRMAPGGILSGYTIVEHMDGTKSLPQHEYEFESKEDLMRFLEPHFNNVTVFETIYPDRHNLYFWASDNAVPFGADWPSVIRSSRGDTSPLRGY